MKRIHVKSVLSEDYVRRGGCNTCVDILSHCVDLSVGREHRKSLGRQERHSAMHLVNSGSVDGNKMDSSKTYHVEMGGACT